MVDLSGMFSRGFNEFSNDAPKITLAIRFDKSLAANNTVS